MGIKVETCGIKLAEQEIKAQQQKLKQVEKEISEQLKQVSLDWKLEFSSLDKSLEVGHTDPILLAHYWDNREKAKNTYKHVNKLRVKKEILEMDIECDIFWVNVWKQNKKTFDDELWEE